MLFDTYSLRGLTLANRIVMAPMTRSRASADHVPNALMAIYYGQRASAGLIVSEGTSPSANGLGYPRIPGLFNQAHVDAWRLVTDAVHAKGAKIFVQLMHCGRVGHVANLPFGAEVLGPTGVACPGEMFTDSAGMQPHSPPRAMTIHDIAKAKEEYVASARLAIKAGFDGVELHGANGYLIEQFLNPRINTRTDIYGGSNEGRNRLALEIASATIGAIGADKVGMRLSPYGVFNGTGDFPELRTQFLALAHGLSELDLLYLHHVDHSAMGAPALPKDFTLALRGAFDGDFILCGGFDRMHAERALEEKRGDLIAFGRPFLANPDLVARLLHDAPLNTPDMATFYVPGTKGYTDYPEIGGDVGIAANMLDPSLTIRMPTRITTIAKPSPCVFVFDTHAQAEGAIRKLAHSGFNMQQLSIIGKGYHSEEQPMGFYTVGDRIQSWGGTGALWGGIWGILMAPALFFFPGLGLVGMAGPIVSVIVSALEGAVVVGGLSVVGAALAEIGASKDQVIKYEAELKVEKFLLVVHGNAREQESAHEILSQETLAMAA